MAEEEFTSFPEYQGDLLDDADIPSSRKPEFWDTYQPTGLVDSALMGKGRNILWPLIKTAEALMPFGKFLGVTHSGSLEWDRMSTGEKFINTGLDALALTPVALLGKGFKVAAKLSGASKFFRRTPKFKIEALETMGKGLRPFEVTTVDDVLIRKWQLTEYEAIASGSARSLTEYVEKVGIENISDGLKKALVSQKTGYGLRKQIKDEVKLAQRPREFQMWDFYEKEWGRVAEKVLGSPYISKENREKTLRALTRKLYGDDAKAMVTLQSASPKLFHTLALRMLDDPGKFRRFVSIGAGSVFPTKLQPVRFILGAGDETLGTMKIFDMGVESYGISNAYGFKKIELFSTIMQSKGLGKLKHKASGDWRFKLDKRYTDDYHNAGPVLVDMGEMSFKGIGAMVEEQAKILASMTKLYNAQTPGVRSFVDSWIEWSDVMYLDHMEIVIPRLFEAAGYKRSIAKFLKDSDKGILTSLSRTFRSSNDVATYGKSEMVAEKLKMLRTKVDDLVGDKQIVTEQGEKLKKLLTPNDKNNPEGFLNYLDNYVVRIGGDRVQTHKQIAGLLSDERMAAFYTKARTLQDPENLSTILGDFVTRRANAQAKELMFYPTISEMAKLGKGLPDNFREYIGHWIFRMLGQPSPVDTKLARWLEGTYGRLERLWGGTGVIDERRVMTMAYNINNMIYMGGLGFKPFSALRNLFQISLVPTDLGGMKDIRWLAKGIHNAAQPGTRAYIRSIGAIQEYAPEIHLRAQALNIGKRIKFKGKDFTLPTVEGLRDTAMWMFKMSDRWNRYVAGGSAAAKWDHYIGKMVLPGTGGMINPKFLRKINTKGRRREIAEKIDDLVRTGGQKNIADAKAVFVNDVINDTQFVYGVTGSAIASQAWGSPAKTALVFQSWWMNYGRLLEKWMTTGDVGTKANRAFSFILSAAIAEQLMEPIWGRSTAMRTVGFGPFPDEFSQFMIPPAYAPVYYSLKAVIDVGKGSFDQLSRDGNDFLRASTMFIPGGLQLRTSIKGLREEGAEGFLKSIIGFKGNK